MLWFVRTYAVVVMIAALSAFVGCGVTRSTDTARTATEQLLVSDAIDRAISSMNVRTLAGQTVFLDDTKVSDAVDKNYLVSSLRQYLLANGCQLKEKREDADFVVEARAGAVGTDRNDLLFGLPSMNVPQIPLVQPVPAVIPEIPIAKRKDQRGVAKIAVFAYHRATGAPVWQSGLVHEESSANDVWIMGAGPFQRGTIYEGTAFAGKAIGHEEKEKISTRRLPPVELARESLFTPPQQFAKKAAETDQKVVQASHEQAAPKTPPAAAAASAPPAPVATAAAPSKAPAQPQSPPTSPPGSPPASPQAGLSASVDMSKSRAGSSADLQPEAEQLPQPRFNSPK